MEFSANLSPPDPVASLADSPCYSIDAPETEERWDSETSLFARQPGLLFTSRPVLLFDCPVLSMDCIAGMCVPIAQDVFRWHKSQAAVGVNGKVP